MRTNVIWAVVLFCGAWPVVSDAGVILTIQQSGSNVVASETGSLNTTGFTRTVINSPWVTLLNPSSGFAILGPYAGFGDGYVGSLTGPSSFGPGGEESSFVGSGPKVGIEATGALFVPPGYVSGTAITGSTATFSGATFSSLGITPGIYLWTWGSGATADSFEIVAGSVPEPASVVMLSLGLATVAGMASRPRRARRAA
jgi:hypothetical protein